MRNIITTNPNDESPRPCRSLVVPKAVSPTPDVFLSFLAVKLWSYA
jgi:hypothetical protein